MGVCLFGYAQLVWVCFMSVDFGGMWLFFVFVGLLISYCDVLMVCGCWFVLF